MSYISPQDIAITENLYGRPVECEVKIDLTIKELEIIKNSQHDGRAHDITVFITNRDKLLFIAKHFYPRDLFRAPSGRPNRAKVSSMAPNEKS